MQRLARSDPHHTQPPSSHSLPSPRSAEARCFPTPPNTAQHYFTLNYTTWHLDNIDLHSKRPLYIKLGGQTSQKLRVPSLLERRNPQNIKVLSALLLETLQGSHWGSRGREFKSRHSDQQNPWNRKVSGIFLCFWEWILEKAFFAFGICSESCSIFENVWSVSIWRYSLFSMLIFFLEVNGIRLECTNEEIVEVGLAVASGVMGYEPLLEWVHDHRV